jgi:hypothetical protein
MLSARLRNFITVDMIKREPTAYQMANSISQIMIECNILPTQENFLEKIVPECIAIAAELDKSQERDVFSIGLDNQLKPLLRASMHFFPLSIEPAKRPETPVAEKKDDEDKPESDKGPTAADPAAGAQPSGPGPINFNINYVRYPDPAERQKKIDALAAAAKKRREEERKQYELRLQQDYIRYLIEHIRENLVEKKTLETEIVAIGDSIKQQFDAWAKAWFARITLEPTPVNIPDQLKIDVAVHDKKIEFYRQYIYMLYSNSVGNSAYFKKHDSNFAHHYNDLADVKVRIRDRIAHENKVKAAEANPYGQEAMDIRMEALQATTFLARERQERELKRQQEELLKLQQEEQLRLLQQAWTSNNQQVNYRR